jgi:diguanylate cyclase (GGDEF)-like protein
MAALFKATADAHQGGTAGRWGGEEFFIILPGTGSDTAMDIAEDLRKKVEDHTFPEVEHLTISLGVITAEGDLRDTDVFTNVDKALYAAKEGGRNRIVKAEV